MSRGFSLVELIIVVAVLGIIAAIALPTFQGQVTAARGSAAKDNLYMLRSAIGYYAAQHNGMAPGYLDGSLIPSIMIPRQFTYYTSATGGISATKSDDFPYGPYLKKFPENPFNDQTEIIRLTDEESFPGSADGSYGWIYKPATKEIRLDWPGTDKNAVRYYDY